MSYPSWPRCAGQLGTPQSGASRSEVAEGTGYPGRLIEPGEIARTIRFCAQNAVINGAVIHANLGQVER